MPAVTTRTPRRWSGRGGVSGCHREYPLRGCRFVGGCARDFILAAQSPRRGCYFCRPEARRLIWTSWLLPRCRARAGWTTRVAAGGVYTVNGSVLPARHLAPFIPLRVIRSCALRSWTVRCWRSMPKADRCAWTCSYTAGGSPLRPSTCFGWTGAIRDLPLTRPKAKLDAVLPYETAELFRSMVVEKHGLALFEAVKRLDRRDCGQAEGGSVRQGRRR